MQTISSAAAAISIEQVSWRNPPSNCSAIARLSVCPSIAPNPDARRPPDRPVPCINSWQFHAPQWPGGFSCGARRVSFGVIPMTGMYGLSDQPLQHYPAPGQPIDELQLAEIKGAILAKLRLAIGKDAGMATRRDWYKAAALALRDRIVHRWLMAEKQSYDAGRKRVYYLSPRIPDRPPVHRRAQQYGPVAGVRDRARRSRRRPAGIAQMRAGCRARQWRPRPARRLLHGEHGDARDPRGRLRHPLRFRPVPPDHPAGLAAGISRRVARPSATPGNSSGRRWSTTSISAAMSSMSTSAAATAPPGVRRRPCEAMAYDTPIVGWRGQHVNALRLWSARAPDPLNLDVFNRGDYISANAEQARAEAICKFLYPNDESAAGRELRLRQEYFFVSASPAGSGEAASCRRRAVAQPCAEGRRAAQRHPSEPCRHRADAHPGRPA